MNKSVIHICLIVLCFSSCVEYTPKPRGYVRIEPPAPQYVLFDEPEFPYLFQVSQLVTVELPLLGDTATWINLAYPSLDAKVYCSYFHTDKSNLAVIESESRELVARQARINELGEMEYSNPETHVYATLFLLDGNVASPVQFMITDSISSFFRGALYFEHSVSTDSLRPAMQYIREDMVELIQSFNWK